MYPVHLKFAVFGSSGAGKSSLVKLVRKLSPNVTVHRKDTTRPPRPSEDPNNTLDMQFISKEEFEQRRKAGDYVVVYQKYGNSYGIRRDQFARAFENQEIHFVIVRDIVAIQQLKWMYPDVKGVYVHVDPNNIPGHVKERETLDPDERKRRIVQEYAEYVENNTLFDHVILNFWDDTEAAARQMQNVLHYYVKKAATILK